MGNRKIIGMRPCTFVYTSLVILTFVTFYIGEKGLGGIEIALFVLFIALIKGHLVGSYFMGLGGLKGLWRWPVTVWLILPGALITTAFILAS
jgi:cytochrome c oxidase subunit 4